MVAHLTPEAKAAWTAYYDTHAVEQADLTGDLSAAWSKLEEYAARLALVLHFAHWAAGDPTVESAARVDAASMGAGITLAGWFKGEARRIYAMLGECDAERSQRRLIEWIERKGGAVTVREVQQGCRWLKEPGEAETALGELVASGRGSWQEAPTTARGGRPSRTFVLTPPSTVYETLPTDLADGGSVDVDSGDAVAPPDADPPASPADITTRTRPDGGLPFPDCRGLPD